jgi:L-iduronidase
LIEVDCAREVGALDHFWRATGFTPAELLLDADMKQAMAFAGSVPHEGIEHVRVHYLLNLVMAEGLGIDEPLYDWSRLDEALDVLVKNGLKPFFELMGNPSGYFTDYKDDGQLRAWKNLVRDLAEHLIGRYELDEVRSWYFETWNEPDISYWPHDDEAFCNYYDACSEGLKEADEELRFGGPGTARTLSETFKGLLAHCDTGTNYFTGERGVRIDFISVHEKGAKAHKEDLTPDTASICAREIAAIEYVREHHPRFAGLPFVNNECDPQVGWQDFHTWHARPYYAALVCRVIDQHLKKVVDGMGQSYGLLSNDNGFLGKWGQRTLLARFGEKEFPSGQAEHRTELATAGDDRPFEFVRKPVSNAMTMLSLLGDRRCKVSIPDGASDGIGAIATLRGDQGAILLYNSSDRINVSGSEQVRLSLEGLPFEQAMLAHYRIDEEHGDPFAVWEEIGAPDEPTAGQYAKMRRHAELALFEEPREVETADGIFELELDLPLPSASLVLLSTEPEEPPEAPDGLRIERYPSLTEFENVLVSWRGSGSRTLRTYEVLYAESPDGPFERVNEADTICTVFLHPRGPGSDGYYRVGAVDYWGRRSKLSESVQVQQKSCEEESQ